MGIVQLLLQLKSVDLLMLYTMLMMLKLFGKL